METTRGARRCGRRGAVRGGFTLIELLVVIIIISILIAITFAVGQGVIQGQRARLAQDTIRVADVAVDAYYRDIGGTPPVLVETPGANAGDPPILMPMADAVDGATLSLGEDLRTPINSMGVFVSALEDVGLDEVLRPVSTELLTFFDGDDNDGMAGDNPTPRDNGRNVQPELRTVLDPWGRPMRFVHPRFDGLIVSGTEPLYATVAYTAAGANQLVTASDLPSGYGAGALTDASVLPIQSIRRNHLPEEVREDNPSVAGMMGDSDGGICPSGRPYMYSAGPDGDPSTLDDNVYTTEPTFSAD